MLHLWILDFQVFLLYFKLTERWILVDSFVYQTHEKVHISNDSGFLLHNFHMGLKELIHSLLCDK